jgi:hypothetical protein
MQLLRWYNLMVAVSRRGMCVRTSAILTRSWRTSLLRQD